ncbi:hypothetical protein Nepgr_027089 [Nepenthes gracilis]|uniref:Uncharacterized protein n=1 Tax=Nepenthes gracilis TaxID=150966 RepID=A0AAD3Y373_NEPGR|nr:hypothetical protein Nepgr_027089 [Nepenthes gracilis]
MGTTSSVSGTEAPECLEVQLPPVAAEMDPMDVDPNLAPNPSGFVKVVQKNVPQISMALINHSPLGGLVGNGLLPVPCVSLNPTPSVVPLSLQLDDRPPTQAELFKSPASCSSPSLLTGHASFAEVLCRGLDADFEGFSVASAALLSSWPTFDVDHVDFVPSCLPPEPGFVRDHAVDSPLSPLDVPVIHHDLTPLEVDLDNTPNSISCITIKYSLDTSSNIGPESISLRGSLADSPVGQHPVVPGVKFYKAMDVTAMQHGSWKPVKPRRHRKSTFKDSTVSSRT